MSPYFPVTVCRSDGLLEVITKMGVKELNRPTPAQLDDTPDADGTVDCYRELDSNETKVVDWRRKLGGMLMKLLGGREHSDRNYILKELPEGFVLWEHVKYKVDGSTDDKKHKGKHAAGPYERQDAYLYGHPQGRKKRYRSPADFFPHLLWLATDKESDRRNCSCKICSPEGEEESADTVKVEVKKEAKPSPAPMMPRTAPAPSKPAAQAPLPSVVRSAEQKLDGEPNGKFLYRTGELVWFEKPSGQGLAIISKRQVFDNKARYLIQPLSNPVIHPSFEIRDLEEKLRPYLAWSVPDPPNLQQFKNLSFDQVPWEQIVRGIYGEPNYEIDGSIFAAKGIDSSYSLFDRIENPLAAQGEVHYNGMFLGAEKIWTGEPVRLRVHGADSVVLIIQKLIEHTTPTTSSVTFVGDVYKFVEMPTPFKNRSEWPTPTLPLRMVADLRFRNEVAERRGIWHEWRLIETGAKKGLPDIKGRWYESRTMMPILAKNTPDQYQRYLQDLARGVTMDVGTWMNGTGDGTTGPRQRKKNRRDTLGRAVAADFKVSRGLDGPPADNMFPDTQPHQHGQQDIDQYMDFES